MRTQHTKCLCPLGGRWEGEQAMKDAVDEAKGREGECGGDVVR